MRFKIKELLDILKIVSHIVRCKILAKFVITELDAGDGNHQKYYNPKH